MRSAPLAYIDMGSGSFLLQFLIAGLAGALFALKMFWGRIADWFRKRGGEGEGEEEDAKQDG